MRAPRTLFAKPLLQALALTCALALTSLGPTSVAAQPYAEGTAQTEQALKLDREFRAELQLRLQLLGHDPKGTDGVFGPNSRKAITSWQESINATPTGYFSVDLMDALILESQTAMDAWSLENPEGEILKPVVSSPRTVKKVKTCTNLALFKVCKIK